MRERVHKDVTDNKNVAITLSKENLIQLSVGSLIALGGILISASFWTSGKLNELADLKQRLSTAEQTLSSVRAEAGTLNAAINKLKCRDQEFKRGSEHSIAMWQSLVTSIDLSLGANPAAGAGREHIEARMKPLIDKAGDWTRQSEC